MKINLVLLEQLIKSISNNYNLSIRTFLNEIHMGDKEIPIYLSDKEFIKRGGEIHKDLLLMRGGGYININEEGEVLIDTATEDVNIFEIENMRFEYLLNESTQIEYELLDILRWMIRNYTREFQECTEGYTEKNPRRI